MKAIKTKYLSATNTRGSRISAMDSSGNNVTISYPLELSDMNAYAKAAIALCKKMGWTGTLHGGELSDGYVFVFAPKRITNRNAYKIA